MNEYEDTYFFNAQEALRVASEQNRSANNDNLQVCYYDGDYIESDLPNLIHQPVDTLLEDLAKGRYRVPTKIDLNGLDLSASVKMEITTNFNVSLLQIQEYRNRYNDHYFSTLKNSILSFDEPLRFFIPTNANTRVMQYVAKDIANVLQRRGYDVKYDLYYGIEDDSCVKNIMEYNPHVVINLNNINNTFPHDECFTFTWFQDLMAILYNNEKIDLRDRDFLFSYTKFYTNMLIKKHVSPDKIFTQDIIPVDTEKFFLDKTVKKEEKIIFVGSYYSPLEDNPYINENIDSNFKKLLEDGISLTKEKIHEIFSKNGIELPENEAIIDHTQQSYIRNACVTWLSENEHLTTEVYGYRWEESNNENIMKHFAGKIEKDDLNMVYNKSKYVLSASGGVINTQRLGEIVHSGAIPVVYDSRDISNENEKWDDECLYFRTQEELNYILDNQIEPKKYMSKKILEHFTYDKFIQTILDEIKKKTN